MSMHANPVNRRTPYLISGHPGLRVGRKVGLTDEEIRIVEEATG